MWCRLRGARCVDLFYALSGQGMFGVAVMFAYVDGCRPPRSIQRHGEYVRQQILHGPGHSGGRRVIALAGDFRFAHHPVGCGSQTAAHSGDYVCLGVLMVSTIKYRSFKDLKFKKGDHFTYLVWGILALMLIVAWPQAMLFVAFSGYAVSGPLARLWTVVAKGAGKPVTKVDGPVLDSRE